MTVIETIRQATKEAHEELDATLLPYIKSIRSADDYTRLLIAFYGFFKPVYDAIYTHLQTSLLPDHNTRRQPADILENLDALDRLYSVNHFCRQLPRIHNNASAFGALYVMEGSTLGGLMIKKMLAEQTGLRDEQLSFFAGYGKETRMRWDRFAAALNGMAQNESEEQEAVATAVQTFICFKNWLAAIYF